MEIVLADFQVVIRGAFLHAESLSDCTNLPLCSHAYRSAGRSSTAYRHARKTVLCSPVNGLAPRGAAAARPTGRNGPQCGFTYSQTVWPAGVTSRRRPKAPSVINV